jgi:1-acyl-sn-glycerol-3-phosphate acyltransferase
MVPAAIDGSWELLRHKAYPIPFGIRVRVRFGDPLPRHPDEDRRKVLETIRDEIAATLEEWRTAP